MFSVKLLVLILEPFMSILKVAVMAELIPKPVALLAGLVDDTAGVQPDLLPEEPPPAPQPARKKTTAVAKARLK